MEDDLRTAPCGRAHRLGVPPAFVADDDAERERADREDAARRPGRVRGVLRRVELHLVLEPEARAVRPEDERRREECLPLEALRSEDDADVCLPRGLGYALPRVREERRIGRTGVLPEATVTRDVALREADDEGADARGVRDGVLGLPHGLLGRLGIPQVREGDADDVAHGSARR